MNRDEGGHYISHKYDPVLSSSTMPSSGGMDLKMTVVQDSQNLSGMSIIYLWFWKMNIFQYH